MNGLAAFDFNALREVSTEPEPNPGLFGWDHQRESHGRLTHYPVTLDRTRIGSDLSNSAAYVG
jgi:hypothetical protein